MQLRQKIDELDARDVRVKIVTFDGDQLGAAYVERTKLPWPLLLDRKRKLYSAYGLLRGSWWDLYGLSSVVKYLKLIFTGTFPGKPGSDLRQLGGDVLVAPSGTVVMHHISTGPHDRPSVETILEYVAGSD